MTDKPHELGIEGALHAMEEAHNENGATFHLVEPQLLNEAANPVYKGRYAVIEQVATSEEDGLHATPEIYISNAIRLESTQTLLAKIATLIAATEYTSEPGKLRAGIENLLKDDKNRQAIGDSAELIREEIIYLIEEEERTLDKKPGDDKSSPKLTALRNTLAYLQTLGS